MERDDLKGENKKLKHDLKQLIEEKKHKRSPNPNHENFQLQISDRSSPDGQEIEMVIQELSSKGNYKDTEALKDDQIRLLEDCLEMMKVEFDKMEKYWME